LLEKCFVIQTLQEQYRLIKSIFPSVNNLSIVKNEIGLFMISSSVTKDCQNLVNCIGKSMGSSVNGHSGNF